MLRQRAALLPSQGGHEIGPWLEKYAAELRPDRSIVELGCWLGAGTAHLALGAMKSGAPIHSFDRFVCANAEEQEKARSRAGVHFEIGQDTLPWITAHLAATVPIFYHRCNLSSVEWNSKTEIGLYVDDATKVDKLWLKAMDVFKPYFIPRETILVLMDYFFYETAGDAYAAQKRYIEARPDEFELMEERIGATTTAVFRWLGEK